jgi:hypothetical protein
MSCQHPVDTTDRDLIELERVWQFCKVFSIYTQNVPSHSTALGYTYPEQIVADLHDTLRSPWHDTAIAVAAYDPDYNNLTYALASSEEATAVGSAEVFASELSPAVGYIRIPEFTATTAEELEAIDPAVAAKPNLIVDVVGNLGGDLDGCKASIDLFLPTGAPYVKVTYRKDVLENGDTGTVVKGTWSAQPSGADLEGKKISIVINRESASAAELLAVGLRDGLASGTVRIVGEKSYGKAIGQYVFALVSGAGLKLTGFRFHTLDASLDYHEKGIEPDTLVTGPVDRILTAGRLLDPTFGSTSGMRSRIQQIIDQTYPFLPKSRTPVCAKYMPAQDLPAF